jgi:hypothetical protein
LPGKRLLKGRQQTSENAIHFGSDVGASADSFQFCGQHRCSAITYVGKPRNVPLPGCVSTLQQAVALPNCFELNRQKLWLGMVTQRDERRKGGPVNRFINRRRTSWNRQISLATNRPIKSTEVVEQGLAAPHCLGRKRRFAQSARWGPGPASPFADKHLLSGFLALSQNNVIGTTGKNYCAWNKIFIVTTRTLLRCAFTGRCVFNIPLD